MPRFSLRVCTLFCIFTLKADDLLVVVLNMHFTLFQFQNYYLHFPRRIKLTFRSPAGVHLQLTLSIWPKKIFTALPGDAYEARCEHLVFASILSVLLFFNPSSTLELQTESGEVTVLHSTVRPSF